LIPSPLKINIQY
jgi:hypothetical protein